MSKLNIESGPSGSQIWLAPKTTCHYDNCPGSSCMFEQPPFDKRTTAESLTLSDHVSSSLFRANQITISSAEHYIDRFVAFTSTTCFANRHIRLFVARSMTYANQQPWEATRLSAGPPWRSSTALKSDLSNLGLSLEMPLFPRFNILGNRLVVSGTVLVLLVFLGDFLRQRSRQAWLSNTSTTAVGTNSHRTSKRISTGS